MASRVTCWCWNTTVQRGESRQLNADGNNVEAGKETLANSTVDLIPADTLADAAQKAVAAIA